MSRPAIAASELLSRSGVFVKLFLKWSSLAKHSVQGKDTFVMHKQRGLFSDTSSIMDINKKKIKHKMKKQVSLFSLWPSVLH